MRYDFMEGAEDDEDDKEFEENMPLVDDDGNVIEEGQDGMPLTDAGGGEVARREYGQADGEEQEGFAGAHATAEANAGTESKDATASVEGMPADDADEDDVVLLQVSAGTGREGKGFNGHDAGPGKPHTCFCRSVLVALCGRARERSYAGAGQRLKKLKELLLMKMHRSMDNMETQHVDPQNLQAAGKIWCDATAVHVPGCITWRGTVVV